MALGGVLEEGASIVEGAVGGIQHASRGVAKTLYPAGKAPEALNTKYAKIINKAAEKQRINGAYLWGVFGTESSFGRDNAKGGPFQFEPATARAEGYPLGVNEGSRITSLGAFARQAEATAKYLKSLGINQNPKAALEKYNSGKSGGDATYYNKVVEHAKTFSSWASGLPEEDTKITEETEKNPTTPEGGTWGKFGELGINLILVLAGAALLIYGVMVMVRPRDKALAPPKIPGMVGIV